VTVRADPFSELVDRIAGIGLDLHRETLLRNARRNAPLATKTVKQLPPLDAAKRRSAIVLSAGPSVRRTRAIERLLESKYKGTIVAVDGSYAACLRAGLIPDVVVTLDPHATRVVRWFGDPRFAEHLAADDYFSRQDLDVAARENAVKRNAADMELVNAHAPKTAAIVASSAPETVVSRVVEAGFPAYWWHPLVDDPTKEGSLTRALHAVQPLPCLATGGTVGTAAWVFALQHLKPELLAVTGMDLGYYTDLPIDKTQTYYELLEMAGSPEKVKDYITTVEFPLTGEKFMTDPTYFWYRKNFLHLAKRAPLRTLNCTEAGTLFGDNVDCVRLDDFFKRAETLHG
jgi:hypothetical protein